MALLTQIDKGLAGFWFWILVNTNLAIIDYVDWIDEQINKQRFYRRWEEYF